MGFYLETDRLILRDLEEKDASEFVKQGNDKEINYFNWYLPYPLTLAKAKKIIKKRSVEQKGHRWLYELGIFLKENEKFVGIVSLYDVSKPENKAKLGYWIGKEHRKKGYVGEAVKEIIRFAFQDLKLNKISAKTMEDNEKSMKLLKKLDFRKIGIKKWDKIIDGKKHDVVEWEILNEFI
jgi:[ribosomal protein S5]-alanine N-acetyltransferase